MLCFTLGYESKTLCFVRYLSLTEAAGYNGEGADEQLIPAFEYSVRPPKSKLRGAARALAGQAWSAVEPASSIVHRRACTWCPPRAGGSGHTAGGTR